MKIQWSPLALERAEEAMDFIAAEGRPGAAAAWLDGLFERARNLVPFPEQGRVVPEVGRKEIREIPYQSLAALRRVEK